MINLTHVSVGRLGTTVPEETISLQRVQHAQIDMIERRILRIEMALRRAGIEVENLELPL